MSKSRWITEAEDVRPLGRVKSTRVEVPDDREEPAEEGQPGQPKPEGEAPARDPNT